MKIINPSTEHKENNKKFNKISYEEVRRLFDYDENTGQLIWKVKPCKNIHKGTVVNEGVKKGYSKVGINGVRYKTHRIIWTWHHGYESEYFIDHIDKNKRNNRIENLREVNKQCNMRNSSVRHNSKTGVKGLQIGKKNREKYVAQIVVNGKARHLIFTSDILEAAYHRLAAEQCLGWLDCDKDSSVHGFIKKLTHKK